MNKPTNTEPLPDEFKSIVYCCDLPMPGTDMILFFKHVAGLGQGTHGLVGVTTDVGTDDAGNPVNNHRQDKCRFIFKKLK